MNASTTPRPRTPIGARAYARGGFTLIELLLVMVILAVLAGVVIPKFVGKSKDAKITAAKTQISSFETALDAYEVDNSAFPTAQQGLDALVNAPPGTTDWKGPYLKNIPKDPWGHDYVYHFPGQHNSGSYDVYSAGPDGQEGNDDDITNWSNSSSN